MKLICSSTLAVAGIGSSQVCLVAMQSIAYTRHHLQLDDYIAKCCTISGYHKTYAHVLQPIEGPGNWPILDMPSQSPQHMSRCLAGPRQKEEGKLENQKAPSSVG
jgi:hypothetical protein